MSRARLGGVVPILATFPVALMVPLVASATLIDVILLAVTVANVISWKYWPRPVP